VCVCGRRRENGDLHLLLTRFLHRAEVSNPPLDPLGVLEGKHVDSILVFVAVEEFFDVGFEGGGDGWGDDGGEGVGLELYHGEKD